MRACALALLVVTAVPIVVGSQQQPVQFGGGYAGLDARRQHLVDNWVARFAKTTGQQVEPGPFYDDVLSLSAKTTFDAVTHALVTTRLTDRAGAALGDALALVAEVDTVRGEVAGAPSDRQFRMYVRLTDTAIDLLERSQQFRRGTDNSVYHKGYPINYRALGVPSIQISIALGQAARGRRRRLPVVEFPGGAVQRPPDRVQLRCPRGQQLRPPPQSVERLSELVARLLRCAQGAGNGIDGHVRFDGVAQGATCRQGQHR